jgi:hypothetical protein
LLEFDSKPPVWFKRDLYAGSRERGIDNLADGISVSDLENRLDCCR